MKIIWLISFISSLIFASQSQIVLGTFSTVNNAKKAIKIIDKLIIEDEKVSSFFNNNGLRTLYKKDSKYYVVSIEAFYDKETLLAVLKKVRTKFKDAYTAKLSVDNNLKIVDDPLLQEEPDINALEIPEIIEEEVVLDKETSQNNSTKSKNDTVQKNSSQPQKELIMVNTYLMEIIVFILILLVIVIYFIYKNKETSKSNNLEDIVEPIDMEEVSQEVSEEIIKEVKEPQESNTIEVQERTEAINLDVLSGTEEGTFGEENKAIEKEEVVVETKQNIIPKRAVPSHNKISKNDFKTFAGTKILVAEDNLINQKVISGLLADTGIEITMADDGQEALDVLEKNTDFTMVFMDAHMPRVDGFEATRQIRANPNCNHIVVVALSGDTASDDIKKMTESGMAEHLEKPLRMDALYDIFYAYTGKDEKKQEEVDDNFIEVVMTNELNGDKGLDICGGDESFYHEILDEFVTSYANSAKELETMINSDNFQEANKLLLDITGVAANIGAANLKNIAENLKEALQKEQSYLEILNEYKRHLNSLLKDIKEYK